jgi:hypothetical protein
MNLILIIILISTIAISPLPLPSPYSGAFRGEPISLSVQLRSQNGIPIDNATVLFFHETQNLLLGTAITNSTGFAQFIWIIPPNHTLGPAQLNATYRGDPERYLLPSMVPIPLTIFGQLQNHVQVIDDQGYPIDSFIRLGQRVFFYTTITNENSQPISNITVQLIRDRDTVLATKISPLNGSLVFSYLLNHTLNPYVFFTIRSENSGYYNGTDSTVQLWIQNSTVHFLGLPRFWHPSNGYSLQGRLCGCLGEGIPNATIELILDYNLHLESTHTTNDGFFTFNLYANIEAIQNVEFIIIQFPGSPGQRSSRFYIRVISSPPQNPFTQTIDPLTPTAWLSLLHQVSIVVVGCLTLSSSVITLRMKRSTKRIVSH